jgi:hypothetical protein
VEGEAFVPCRIEAIHPMGMVFEHPIIHLPVCTHSMVVSLARAVVAYRGVEAAVGPLGAAEGSVVGGGNAWGPRWNPGGSTKTFFPKVDPLPPH